jgi:hypothetical protein
LKEGVRKQTGQQRVRDFLGQGRQPNAPRQSTAPLPVTPERSQRATQALARQEQQRAAQVDPRTLRGQTKPAESSDFNRRDRIQAGHQSIKVQQTQQQPVRRDSNGNVIRDKQPQAQRNAPSPKPTTPPGRQYTGHQSLRNQQPADGYKVNQPKSTAGGGRTFDATGELRGINPGKPVAGTRSQQATNQARATIKAILKGLYEQTPSAEVNRRIKQLERLLKK